MIRVGTGGWSYEPWRGPFYPAGLPKSKEFEILIEFTRHSGNQGFGLHVPVAGKGFLAQLSGVDNQFVALNDFDEKLFKGSHVRFAVPGDGKRHQMRVQVRKATVVVYFDAKPVIVYKTDYSNLTTRDWGFDRESFGLISWYNVITFHRVEVKDAE